MINFLAVLKKGNLVFIIFFAYLAFKLEPSCTRFGLRMHTCMHDNFYIMGEKQVVK